MSYLLHPSFFYLDDIQGHASGIQMFSLFFLVLFVAMGVLVDQEKQHEQKESLGDQVTGGLVDELEVEHIFGRNDGQRLIVERKKERR